MAGSTQHGLSDLDKFAATIRELSNRQDAFKEEQGAFEDEKKGSLQDVANHQQKVGKMQQEVGKAKQEEGEAQQKTEKAQKNTEKAQQEEKRAQQESEKKRQDRERKERDLGEGEQELEKAKQKLQRIKKEQKRSVEQFWETIEPLRKELNMAASKPSNELESQTTEGQPIEIQSLETPDYHQDDTSATRLSVPHKRSRRCAEEVEHTEIDAQTDTPRPKRARLERKATAGRDTSFRSPSLIQGQKNPARTSELPASGHQTSQTRKTRKDGRSKGRLSPQMGKIYRINDRRCRSGYAAALVLPIGDFDTVGIRRSILDTNLKTIPSCYRYDEHKTPSIIGWQKGYNDGEPYVTKRKFPCMVFKGNRDIPLEGEFTAANEEFRWIEADRFRPMNFDDQASRPTSGWKNAKRFSDRLNLIRKRRGEDENSINDEEDDEDEDDEDCEDDGNDDEGEDGEYCEDDDESEDDEYCDDDDESEDSEEDQEEQEAHPTIFVQLPTRESKTDGQASEDELSATTTDKPPSQPVVEDKSSRAPMYPSVHNSIVHGSGQMAGSRSPPQPLNHTWKLPMFKDINQRDPTPSPSTHSTGRIDRSLTLPQHELSSRRGLGVSPSPGQAQKLKGIAEAVAANMDWGNLMHTIDGPSVLELDMSRRRNPR